MTHTEYNLSSGIQILLPIYEDISLLPIRSFRIDQVYSIVNTKYIIPLGCPYFIKLEVRVAT